MKIIPTILCGGSGTRLWPLSRTHAPKQLQALTNEKSLLANTVLRLASHPNCIDPVLICGRSYVEEIEEQMAREGASLSAIITEPKGRDTAAAAAMAAHWGAKVQNENSSEDYIVLLLPADHHISNIAGFHDAVEQACIAAVNGNISTIGISPNAPETGFGYINRAESKLEGLESYPIKRFVEKPDKPTAETYLASGDYLWNAGMFAFRPDVFLDELKALEPAIAEQSKIAFNDSRQIVTESGPFRIDLNPRTFLDVPALSVDYAVMERTTKASVLPAEFGWNDVGSWAAAYEISDLDMNGNALLGDVVAVDTKNTFVKSYDKLIAAVDVDNLIIVETADAILVCPRDSSQKVKSVHKKLAAKSHASALHHGNGTPAHKKVVQQHVKDWLFDKAFPFWMDAGLDRQNGGAFEAVDFNGRPLTELPRRIRVQARQTYILAHAHLLGVEGALAAMQIPLRFLLDKCQIAKGRFAHIVAQDGSVIAERADSYDHAFVLYALAWAYKVTGDKELLQTAEDTLTFLNDDLRHEFEGFKEEIPASSKYRRANPHMHLFEAAMAWMRMHQHDGMANLAQECFHLFQTRFCVNGLLREYFDDSLSPIKRSDNAIDLAVEPGHLYEWAYLLRLYEQLGGEESEAPAIMEAFADQFGHNAESGLVLDHVFPNGGSVLHPTSRLWPQTEYIRLKLFHETPEDDERALAMVERLFENYMTFDGNQPGYWKDQLSVDGKNLIERAPGSSFYHILGCFAPLLL